MASISARRFLQRSTTTAKAFLGRNPARTSPSGATAASGPSNLGGVSSATSFPRRPFFSSARLPVELGSGDSLMPLHSVTASALLNSLLSSSVGRWGCLSEGFATPL